jgi:hypothetical protein
MRKPFLSDPSALLSVAQKLFAEKPPLLVEVRFPRMGTSSDWFLCDDAATLDAILDRLGPGAEVHLNSVWDLKGPAGTLMVRENKQATLQVVGLLFEEKPPLLVEVRFPKMGTSSDWFLCDDAAALDTILDRLEPAAETRLNSVWDLKSLAPAIVFRASKPPMSVLAAPPRRAQN